MRAPTLRLFQAWPGSLFCKGRSEGSRPGVTQSSLPTTQLADAVGLQISCAGRAGGEEDRLASLLCHKAHLSFQLLLLPEQLTRSCIPLEQKSRPLWLVGTPKERLLLAHPFWVEETSLLRVMKEGH